MSPSSQSLQAGCITSYCSIQLGRIQHRNRFKHPQRRKENMAVALILARRATTSTHRNIRCLHTLRNVNEASGMNNEKETRAIHDGGRDNLDVSPELTLTGKRMRHMEVDGSHVTFRGDAGITTFLFHRRQRSNS